MQRRATELEWGLKDLAYEDRLQLFSLEEWRLHGDLMTFKLLTGKENVNPELVYSEYK